jgi:hypothetical protein
VNPQTVWQRTLGFVGSKPVIIETSNAQLTSDAGLLPIREFDESLGFTRQFADALEDTRDARYTTHSFLEMTRSRVFGILADYEDQNDHDALRHDPVFKIIAGGSLEKTLASQPTHSRFENAIDIPSLFRLRDVLIDQFIESFALPPGRLTLDIDTFDDPAHGQQQLVLFHGHYGQYQYQPRVITCAENDMVVMPCLLYGSAPAALGAADDVAYLVERLRAVWPDIDIELRADSGFGVPEMFDTCERLRLWYSIGYGMNPVLKRNSEDLLNAARDTYAETGEPQRRFTSFDYQARSWPHRRHTIVKCEVNAEGTNRRGVVTNRSGAPLLPEAAYDDYVDRGESENRNKELKCGLSTDRLSDHRYMANLFRLFLHVQAHNLLVRIRREIAAPPQPLPDDDALPVEALSGRARKQFANLRRRADPLGEGHPATWRTRLIKVAAEVVERARCIRVRLSGSWPYLAHYAALCTAASAFATNQVQQE